MNFLINLTVITTYYIVDNYSSQQKFADTPDAANAYQIFPGPLSAAAKTATASFIISTQSQSDGSTVVSLTSSNPEYQNQKYTVKSGQKLYFVERSLGDDSPDTNNDGTVADDTVVIVDAQGFVVQL